MELIQTQTLSGNASSITFSNIPQTYKDLYVLLGIKYSSGSSTNPMCRINGNSSSIYRVISFRNIAGTRSGFKASNYTYIVCGGGDILATSYGRFVCELDFLDYTNTSRRKTARAFSGLVDRQVSHSVSSWANTSAITSLTFSLENSANMEAGTSISIYGIG